MQVDKLGQVEYLAINDDPQVTSLQILPKAQPLAPSYTQEPVMVRLCCPKRPTLLCYKTRTSQNKMSRCW